MRLEQLPLLFEASDLRVHLGADLVDGPLDGRLRSDVLGGGPDREVVELREHFARERIEVRHPLHVVGEEGDAVRGLLVRRLHLDDVALHAEAAAAQHRVVADVLRVDELAQHEVAVVLGADLDVDHPLTPLLRRAEAVDAGDGRDHDHVATGEERRGRGEPQPRDVVVAGRVLLDVEVGLRDVRLGLVVVVVGDEVLDCVVREELPELVAELRRERLVMGDHERRTAGLLDRPGHRRRLAGAGRADERLELLTGEDPVGELLDRPRLVAGRAVVGGRPELGHSGQGIAGRGPHRPARDPPCSVVRSPAPGYESVRARRGGAFGHAERLLADGRTSVIALVDVATRASSALVAHPRRGRSHETPTARPPG